MAVIMNKEVFCLGCGDDLYEKSGNHRSLTASDNGRKVAEVWKSAIAAKSDAFVTMREYFSSAAIFPR